MSEESGREANDKRECHYNVIPIEINSLRRQFHIALNPASCVPHEAKACEMFAPYFYFFLSC